VDAQTRKVISFLLEPAAIARITRLASALRARQPGLRITRPDAARAAVQVGLDALEREMGIAAPHEKSAPRVR
jgi:hypothetical protein